jgi:hypothetical protein
VSASQFFSKSSGSWDGTSEERWFSPAVDSIHVILAVDNDDTSLIGLKNRIDGRHILFKW